MKIQKRGRPTLTGVRMRKCTYTLDERSIRIAEALGNGSISAGIRRALEIALPQILRDAEKAPDSV